MINILISNLLTEIGEDINREGLKDTPKRIEKMFKEIFKGYDSKKLPKVTTFLNGQDGIIYDQMIIDTGTFFSMCEHHMLPFYGEYYFGYIPDIKGKILGLSKVARVVEYFSSKLQIQERLGSEIVKHLWEQLEINNTVGPKGMILVLKAKHLCKCMRGIKNNGNMITCEINGVFKKDKVKKEFFDLINIK